MLFVGMYIWFFVGMDWKVNNPELDIFVGTQIKDPFGSKNHTDIELECALRWDVYLVLRWDGLKGE